MLREGQRYGRLRLLERTVFSKRAKWLALCDCGKIVEVWASSLGTGATKSCGCLRIEQLVARNRTHGESHTALYRVWQEMWRRCTVLTDSQYKNYGARGIGVCARWRRFTAFKLDMGERPSGHSLERQDNNKGYCPSNVVWASAHTQSRNTRRNILITCQGRTMVLKDWAKELGINPGTLLDRIQVQGLPPEVALTKPVKRKVTL